MVLESVGAGLGAAIDPVWLGGMEISLAHLE
jgi:hypothetical protein